MDEIISPNKLNIERIDRLISLCDSLPLPQPEPVDDLDIDLDKEQAFQDDLAKKTKYKLTLGKFLLKARDNIDNVDLSELFKTLIKNFLLVFNKFGFDEFSDIYMTFEEILTSSDESTNFKIKSTEVDIDDRITMAPPTQQSFVAPTISVSADEDDFGRSSGDAGGDVRVIAGGGGGSKKTFVIDQF